MKLKLKRTGLTVLFLCIFILGLLGLYRILSWKDTSGEYFSSFEQLKSVPENTVDAVAIGPSLAYGSFNPAYFWKEAGIASFTMSVSGMAQDSAYYTLKEFLKTQSPKVVFVESVLLHTDEYLDEGNVYRNTILMNPSKDNTELIKETVGKEELWKYLLRFPIVHSRYSELKKSDFVNSIANEYAMGFTFGYNVESQTPDYSIFTSGEMTEISGSTKEWIDKLYALSKEHGFELVFYSSPQNILLYYQKILNGCYEYLDTLGIKHYDMKQDYENIDIDYSKDFSDHSHINRYGADKVCEYLLINVFPEFGLADHRGDSGYSRWDMCARYDDCLVLEHKLQAIDSKEQLILEASSYDGMLVASRVNDVISVSYADESYTGDEEGVSIEIPGIDEYLFANKDIVYVGSECVIASGLEGDIVYILDTVTGNVICNRAF